MASSSTKSSYELVNPGPIDRTVLYKQDQHISEKIWNGQGWDKFEVCGSARGIEQWHLSAHVSDMIDNAGFGLMLTPSCIVRTDNGLIQALIERWRPETNTFHLPIGECSITLEDVGFILGIPISGFPIAQAPLKSTQLTTYTQFFGGIDIDKGSITGHGLKLTSLRRWFSQLPENPTPEQRINQCKAYILDCIGSVLLPCSGKTFVHARYCQFLSNLENISGYSWGSAVLCHLYRELRRCALQESKAFFGCAALLQIWAWERISIGRPIPRPDSDHLLPRAMAWRYGKEDRYKGRRHGEPSHSVVFFRGELDRLDEYGEFEWMPYRRWANIDGLEEHQTYTLYGSSSVPLICFDCVEYQMPDRVLRQFGLSLEIPVNPPNFDELRVKKERDFERPNPMQVHLGRILHWNHNEDEFINIVVNKSDQVCSLEDYLNWYRRITRLRIARIDLQAPKSDKYRPRSVFSESHAHDLIEGAAAVIKDSFPHVSQLMPEIKGKTEKWVENYQEFSQVWRDPDFKFDLVQPDFLLETQTTSNITFLETPIVANPIKECPPLPQKEKGKEIIIRPDDDIPSFELGLTPSQLQSLEPPTKHLPAFSLGFSAAERESISSVPRVDPPTCDDLYMRPLEPIVKDWLDRYWWSIPEKEALEIDIPLYFDDSLDLRKLQSLKKGEQVWEQVVNAYISILLRREQQRKRSKQYWVAMTEFMRIAQMQSSAYDLWTKSKDLEPFKFSSNIVAMIKGMKQQRTMNEAQYALIPFLHSFKGGVNHFSLFLINIEKWKIIVIDSLLTTKTSVRNSYKSYLPILFHYLPYLLRQHLGIQVPEKPKKKWKLKFYDKSPKQQNGSDCGIFVLKAIDVLLRDSGPLPEEWTRQQVLAFRYRIAWELKHHHVGVGV